MNRQILLILIAATAGAYLGRALPAWWELPATLLTAAHAQQTLSPAPPVAARQRPPAGPAWRDTAAESDPRLNEDWTAEERVNIQVYERANRGVVHITTQIPRTDRFRLWQVEPAQGSGSGSVIDTRGHILTNHHVIEDAVSARVTLWDGQSYDAVLVGTDPANDVAVLRIDAPEEALFPLEQGDSSRLRVGQNVYAIGNPFGLERTLTAGILSSLNRSLPSRSGRTIKSILQVDAALNRGNSGGPLLDSRGRAIGMNTAIASPSGSGENTGIGFAIPSNTLKRIIPELILHGRITRPGAGVAEVYETRVGLVVARLVPGGPAERAGIRAAFVREQIRQGAVVLERSYFDRNRGDIIVAVDGEAARTADDFLTLIDNHKPGDQTIWTIIRDDREMQVPVTLGADD